MTKQIPQWRCYEEQILGELCRRYPNAKLELDSKIKGQFSKVIRQVDILIRQTITDIEVIGVIECKYYNRKINVKIIESFISFLEDIKANFGVIVTNHGFTPAAENRASVHNLILKIETLQTLSNLPDSQDISTQLIHSLKLTQEDFFARQKRNWSLFDPHKSNYEERTIIFREGFADTKPIVMKKLLHESMRVFRDFPEIGKIKIIIPALRGEVNSTTYEESKRVFWSEVTCSALQDFLGVNFYYLRESMENWRECIESEKLASKVLISKFAEKYVMSRPYSNYEEEIFYHTMIK